MKATSQRVLPHLLIRASAGTGKTYQLAHRYLALLYHGVSPERILAATFTRKAAGEILDRIVARLAEACLQPAKRAELAQALNLATLEAATCQQMLLRLLRNLHRLRISTLDSLFAQMARAFSLEIGLPPQWRIIDEADEIRLRESALDAVLHGQATAQVLAVTHLLSKGETSRGIGQLLRETVADLHTLFQETDADAWNHVPRHRQLEAIEFESLLEELRQLPLPVRQMQEARDKDYTRLINRDWEAFLDSGIGAKVLNDETTYRTKPIPEEAIALYRRLLGEARAVLVNRLALQTEGSLRLLEQFDRERQKLLVQEGGVRFDDITHALDRALRQAPTTENTSGPAADGAQAFSSGQDLVHRLDGLIAHVLLDEFQDTSPRQWRSLRTIIDRVTQRDGPGTFFCVGDVKQAIYGWRGGVAEIFDAIEQRLPDLTRDQLTMSYRSSLPVIEVVNEVFRGAASHPRLERAAPAVEAWCRRFEAHSTRKTESPGHVQVMTAPLPEDDQNTAGAVLEYAATRIAELHRQCPRVEMGVLVRKNETVARLITLLRQQNLPVSEEGGNPLTDSAAVRVVLSALRLADHPGDRVASFHVASSPLGPTLGLVADGDAERVRCVAAEIRRGIQTQGYGPFIQKLAAHLYASSTPRDRSRLNQLIDRAYAFRPPSRLRTNEFLARVELERVAEPTRAPIRVMTIHQSKGLEFDTVVLPELDVDVPGSSPSFVIDRPDPVAPVSCVCRYTNASIQKLLPERLQAMFAEATRAEVTEAMCLMYVALTRAVHAMYIVLAPSRPNEKLFPRSLAGMVRAALVGTERIEPSQTLYERGDPSWFTKLSSPPTPPATTPPRPTSATIELAASDRRQRGLERLTPSGLEGGIRIRLDRWLLPDSDRASFRGTVLHACLAKVKWIDEPLPTDAEFERMIHKLLRDDRRSGHPAEYIAEFRRLVQLPAVRAELIRQRYRSPESLGFSSSLIATIRDCSVDVETELPFAIHEGAALLSGSIDRLVVMRTGDRVVAADILDFKTDAVGNPSTLQQRVEYYRPQMNAYRRAVSQLLRLAPERIAARLLFLATGAVENIET